MTIHHVLHFLDEPMLAVQEAARVLRPEGRLIIVDLAPHQLESLRSEHAHRRLGLEDAEVRSWCEAAGLENVRITRLRNAARAGNQSLGVDLWCCARSDVRRAA